MGLHQKTRRAGPDPGASYPPPSARQLALGAIAAARSPAACAPETLRWWHSTILLPHRCSDTRADGGRIRRPGIGASSGVFWWRPSRATPPNTARSARVPAEFCEFNIMSALADAAPF